MFWLLPILLFSLLKAIFPFNFTQKIFSYLLDLMASNWVAMNSINQKLFTQTELVITGLNGLNEKDWYLVLANHQSWGRYCCFTACFAWTNSFFEIFS